MSSDKSWFDSLKIGGAGALAGFALTNFRIRSVFRGLRLRWRNDCRHPQFTKFVSWKSIVSNKVSNSDWTLISIYKSSALVVLAKLL